MAELTLAQRVRSAVTEWQKIGAPPSLLRWITQGVKIEWEGGPPPPFELENYHIPEEARGWWLNKELSRFLEIGAIEAGQTRRWKSPAFLVPKSEPGEWRLVIDLRRLNRYCKKKSIKLETLKQVQTIAEEDDMMLVVDIQDGFYHLLIADDFRDFFTFELFGRLYRLRGLPMGWTNSPYYFCKMMRPVLTFLRDPELAQDRR